ncbi:MAG: ATP-binding cassette domain-containing protein [bacterium]|nr:ATP-binding cassette domain-containing protein [bacterium]
MNTYLLQDVQLEDSAEKLSVGQKQRIALSRTLLSKPDLLLCDEPTSALDEQSRQIVETELEHPELAIGVVLVTHLDFQPQKVSLRKFILDSNGLQELTTTLSFYASIMYIVASQLLFNDA